jgi:hypothetical protein
LLLLLLLLTGWVVSLPDHTTPHDASRCIN